MSNIGWSLCAFLICDIYRNMSNKIENCQMPEIQAAIRNSPIGEKLGSIVRWTKFRTDIQSGGETLEQWIELLGPTAIVLTHQEYFVDFVMLFSDLIDSDIIELFMLATAIHDIGEAANGDISAQVKSVADDQAEIVAAQSLIMKLKVNLECVDQLLFAYNQVIAGEDQELHALFKTFERLEYLDTGMHVAKQLNAGHTMQLGWYLVAKVLAMDLSKIFIYRKTHPTIVDRYLENNFQIIESSFQQSAIAVDETFGAKFLDAQESWQAWKLTSHGQ